MLVRATKKCSPINTPLWRAPTLLSFPSFGADDGWLLPFYKAQLHPNMTSFCTIAHEPSFRKNQKSTYVGYFLTRENNSRATITQWQQQAARYAKKCSKWISCTSIMQVPVDQHPSSLNHKREVRDMIRLGEPVVVPCPH